MYVVFSIQFLAVLPPLVLSSLLVMGTPVFRYLICEHCGLSVVLPLHMQNLFLLPTPLPTLSVILMTLSLSLHWDSRPGALPPFTILSCPQVHFLPFPARISQLFRIIPASGVPLWLCGTPGMTQLWLTPSNCLLRVCTWAAGTSWRKHTIGPADLILKSGPRISNELLPTWDSYCISLVRKYFLSHQVP